MWSLPPRGLGVIGVRDRLIGVGEVKGGVEKHRLLYVNYRSCTVCCTSEMSGHASAIALVCALCVCSCDLYMEGPRPACSFVAGACQFSLTLFSCVLARTPLLLLWLA